MQNQNSSPIRTTIVKWSEDDNNLGYVETGTAQQEPIFQAEGGTIQFLRVTAPKNTLEQSSFRFRMPYCTVQNSLKKLIHIFP